MDNQALKTYIEKLITRGSSATGWHGSVEYRTPPCPNSEAASMERMKTPLQKRLLPV